MCCYVYRVFNKEYNKLQEIVNTFADLFVKVYAHSTLPAEELNSNTFKFADYGFQMDTELVMSKLKTL